VTPKSSIQNCSQWNQSCI